RTRGEEGADDVVVPALPGTEDRVGDRPQGDHHDRQPDAAPGRLEGEHDPHRCHRVVDVTETHDLHEVAGQVVVHHHRVHVRAQPDQGEEHVVPGNPLRRAPRPGTTCSSPWSGTSYQGTPFVLSARLLTGYSRKIRDVAPPRWIAPWMREGREPNSPVYRWNRVSATERPTKSHSQASITVRDGLERCNSSRQA